MVTKVTLVGRDLPEDLQIGTKVYLAKEENPYDEYAVAVFDEFGNKIGNLAQSSHTVAPGTEPAKKIYKKLKDDEVLEGKITEKTSYTTKNGFRSISYIIEVEIKDELKTEKEMIEFIFKTKGAKSNYPAKIEVMEMVSQGNVVPLLAKLNNNKIIVYYNDTPAGVVDENSDDYLILKEYLNINKEIRCDAVNIQGTTFFIKVSIPKNVEVVIKTITDFDEIFKRIVNEEIDTMDNLKRKYKYLVENDVPKEEIVKVFNSYEKYPMYLENKIPKNPEVLFNDYFGGVKKSIIYLNIGEFLRYEGDKGSGKNCLITTLAWIYNRPLYEISMNAEIDKQDLQGSKTLEVDDNGNTKIVFEKSSIIEAVEVGGILNLDEVNTVRPEVLVWLHSLADRRRSVYVSGYGKVVAHKNFRMILTMNKDYQGTFELNEATNDRFVPIIFPPVPSIQELLATLFPTLNPQYIIYCQKVYSDLRKAVLDSKIRQSALTIRGFEVACKVANTLGIKEALIDNVANRANDEIERKAIIDIIDNIIG